MSNFDGQNECASILAKIAALCGGRVWEDVVEPVATNADGSIKPYIRVSFGTPIPTGQGRSLGKETVQPHILPVSINSVGASRAIARAVNASVVNLLLGFEPTGNAGQLTGGGGSGYSTTDAAGAVAREIQEARFESIVNLSPALL